MSSTLAGKLGKQVSHELVELLVQVHLPQPNQRWLAKASSTTWFGSLGVSSAPSGPDPQPGASAAIRPMTAMATARRTAL
jgi:hypothetical protein